MLEELGLPGARYAAEGGLPGPKLDRPALSARASGSELRSGRRIDRRSFAVPPLSATHPRVDVREHVSGDPGRPLMRLHRQHPGARRDRRVLAAQPADSAARRHRRASLACLSQGRGDRALHRTRIAVARLHTDHDHGSEGPEGGGRAHPESRLRARLSGLLDRREFSGVPGHRSGRTTARAPSSSAARCFGSPAKWPTASSRRSGRRWTSSTSAPACFRQCRS